MLELLGQANCHADQSINRPDRQRELADRFFPLTFQRWLHELLDGNPNLVPVSSQGVANLAVRALVMCPDGDYTTEKFRGEATPGLAGKAPNSLRYRRRRSC